MRKKPHWSSQNVTLFARSEGVGTRVCLGCLDEKRLAGKNATQGLAKLPHSLIAGVCRFKEPGKVRFEAGEEAYLAQQKRLDREVPF